MSDGGAVTGRRHRPYAWLLHHWDALRGSYWFFPGLMAGLSGASALAVVELDRGLAAESAILAPWLTKVSADGARAVLSTVAGSMITVTGVVFSITVVALTLTSSQFGPRLLRSFFRDRGSQVAFGTFLATFCYSLLVLRAVGTPERVPYLATLGSVILAIASLVVLIFFIHHAASSIQASSVIAAVAQEIREQIPTLFPESLGEDRADRSPEQNWARADEIERRGRTITTDAEGYVRVLDEDAILRQAHDRDALIRLDARPGDFVTRGTSIARVLPPEVVDADFAVSLRNACLLGDHRTPVQDLCFLTDQLAEMAVRALSPGVNDPKTAVECIHRLGGVVAQLTDRSMPSEFRHDSTGRLRVIVAPTRFEAVVASCFDAIRRHGAHDPQVVVALLDAIATSVRVCSSAERLGVLEEHVREACGAFEGSRGSASKRDRLQVERAFVAAGMAIEAARRSQAGRGGNLA